MNINLLLSTILSLCLLTLSFLPVSAADTLVFDSTDHYLGACRLTDKSEWTLSEDMKVTTFQIWYNWSQNETTLPVKVYKDGDLFAEFTSTRSSCDPYQTSWCNADYVVNKTFPSGKYSTQIPTSRQCLKPGGTGTVRLYSAGTLPTAIPTALPTLTPTSTLIPTTAPVPVTPSTHTCDCNQTITIASAVGASAFISLVISFLLRKR